LPYLGIINSKVIGFLFFHLSAQWGKGEGKRDTLRNTDIEKLPIKIISGNIEKDLTALVKQLLNIQNTSIIDLFSSNQDHNSRESLLDRLNKSVFNLYALTEYDEEIINEFYQVKVTRTDNNSKRLNKGDMKTYINTFSNTFSMILEDGHNLLCSYYISRNIGAIMSFEIREQSHTLEPTEDTKLSILHFVKTKQLKSVDAFKVLNEGKVKIYHESKMFIIKSNYFKDWTKRQAIKDAKEEIEQFMKQIILD